MPVTSETLSVVLAGGVGSRLSPLTQDRAKPAVPFGGQYRIIDFTLSNCLHSGLRQILVLSQYKSHSLHQHLRDTWSVFNQALGEHITAVPPQQRTGESWYAGTADAIYQNLFVVQRSKAKYVLVLSGDHIYNMDYSQMLEYHERKGADVTIGCMEVDRTDASAFGVMSVDGLDRIRSFQEKPGNPATVPGRPDKSLASMGIYVFSMDVLCRCLQADHANQTSSHDFGKDILPAMIDTHVVQGIRFGGRSGDESSDVYWRDVGTIDAYYEASMDLLSDDSILHSNSTNGSVHHNGHSAPPARIQRDRAGRPGLISDSLLSPGVVVSGGEVHRSILSPNVVISSGASVEGCVLFDGVQVGEGAQLTNCIVDKGVRIPPGEVIGFHPFADAERFTISSDSVVVVPQGYEFREPVAPAVEPMPAGLARLDEPVLQSAT